MSVSELLERFPNGSAVRAAWFPATVRALRSLGAKRLPLAYAVVVDSGRLRLVSWRNSESVWDTPTSSIQSVRVAETQRTPLYTNVELSIVLSVRTPSGFTDLPIVPISDDGKRWLRWNDAEVRGLARRLSEALKATPSVD